MERAISIRLDDDARHALRTLTKSGRSQSEAVREALIALARSRRRIDLASEAERLSADRGDRAEKKRIAKMMESLRAAG
jgi:Arc/MetJ-type ribon-helix-helix transcriptional regulator